MCCDPAEERRSALRVPMWPKGRRVGAGEYVTRVTTGYARNGAPHGGREARVERRSADPSAYASRAAAVVVRGRGAYRVL